jgi:hypothetical protein
MKPSPPVNSWRATGSFDATAVGGAVVRARLVDGFEEVVSAIVGATPLLSPLDPVHELANIASVSINTVAREPLRSFHRRHRSGPWLGRAALTSEL